MPTHDGHHTFSETIDSGADIGVFLNRPVDATFDFTGLPTPAGNGTLTVSAFGDINNVVETVQAYADTPNGHLFLGDLFAFPTVNTDPIGLTDSVAIPRSAITGDTLTIELVVPATSATSEVRFDSLNLSFDIGHQDHVHLPHDGGLLLS